MFLGAFEPLPSTLQPSAPPAPGHGAEGKGLEVLLPVWSLWAWLCCCPHLTPRRFDCWGSCKSCWHPLENFLLSIFEFSKALLNSCHDVSFFKDLRNSRSSPSQYSFSAIIQCSCSKIFLCSADHQVALSRSWACWEAGPLPGAALCGWGKQKEPAVFELWNC